MSDRGSAASRLPNKAPVVGIPISVTRYEEVLDALERQRTADRALTVAVCNVHSVMSARRDAEIAEAIGQADIATPDGVPLTWALRLIGYAGQPRVYGPDLMLQAFAQSAERGWTHYLYGATEETLERLQANLAERFPGAKVVGAHAPPFRPLSPDEERAAVDDIRASRADLIWVGLGMPKQEHWMRRTRAKLPDTALLGVGAAFDFHAGTIPQAPGLMQRAGLEWLFRLSQEPRRLWRRYLWNNPAYLFLLAAQVLGHRFRLTR